MRIPADRVAGAPISWGVCEVPGWGRQLPAERVLAEMAAIGLTATEAGPEGFLPSDPPAARRLLAHHGLRLVGGFVPAVLHAAGAAQVDTQLDRACRWLAAAGGEVAVVAAVAAPDGYDARVELDAAGWRRLNTNLDRAQEVAAGHGLRAVLHPHVGTVVERSGDVDRVLEGSTIPLCLDTGHLLIGGVDPVELAKRAGERVAHLQLKDVDGALADRVREGRTAYRDAVRRGMYTPLGDGDVDVAGVVEHLDSAGYDGWYVLEQDVVIDEDPPPGSGPANDVARSVSYLSGIDGRS